MAKKEKEEKEDLEIEEEDQSKIDSALNLSQINHCITKEYIPLLSRIVGSKCCDLKMIVLHSH